MPLLFPRVALNEKSGTFDCVERARSGILAALVAFFLWGVLPVYWKQLGFLNAQTIVAQRTVWSLVFVLPLVVYVGDRAALSAALRSPRTLALHGLSGALLAANWLLFVWATLHGHVLEAALGYYLNPFFNMAFGALCFGEKHNRWQRLAIGIAVLGVALRLAGGNGVPWIALGLAVSFALYAVLRKVAPLDALTGLTVETMLLCPIAVAWLAGTSPSWSAAFGHSLPHALWVVSCGAVTAVPLICFARAARTIRLTTLGMLQFLAPTLQFLCGWLLFGERLTLAVASSFALIWLAVGVYAFDAVRRAREQKTAC